MCSKTRFTADNGTERLHVLLPVSIRPSCITNGCSYGESDASNWEYHPEHVDGEVGLMVDKVLGVQENTSNGHWKIAFRLQLKITGGIQDKIIVKLLVQNKIKDYCRNIS